MNKSQIVLPFDIFHIHSVFPKILCKAQIFCYCKPLLSALHSQPQRIQGFQNLKCKAMCKIIYIQSTLVISKYKGLSEILRDIRTSTYQICRIEGKKLIRLTTFNKYMFKWSLEVRDILKILWKRGEIAPKEQFLLFSTIFLHAVRFSCLGRDQIFTSR